MKKLSKNVKKTLKDYGLPTDREPVLPGEIILEEFLVPLKISQRELARISGIPYYTINRIIKGKTRINIEYAMIFNRVLGCSPFFWLNLQNDVDIYDYIIKDKKLKKLKYITNDTRNRLKAVFKAKTRENQHLVSPDLIWPKKSAILEAAEEAKKLNEPINCE